MKKLAWIMLGLASSSFSVSAQTAGQKAAYGMSADIAAVNARACVPMSRGKDEFDACVSKLLDKADTAYKDLAKQVDDKEKKTLLKNHYIALVFQIKGAEPEAGEQKRSYQQRQVKLKKSAQEAWMKFDLE